MPPGKREEWLGEVCHGNRTLYLQVESLLLSVDQESGLLEKQVASYATAVATAPPPERIGPYRIVSEIGHGGMGAVYLAERADEQYQRQVAIKIIRSFASPPRELLLRFRVERQILAGLQHPNIAQMLDGGVTEDGIPYLVMEYVKGVRIDEYCGQKALSVRQRIELFRGVCSAVEHAHRNLVVHRDIKPGNILVTDSGIPKLLDFGIAKLLQPDNVPEAMLATALTTAAERPRTPEYASPEQVNGEAITTATDVYALGIVLYELLAGGHPFADFKSDVRTLERAICETEPRRPSAAASQLHDQGLTPALRGDLDSIVLKAIRKEPKERYVSVDQLGEDLNSYLSGFPVTARRGTRRYRAAKFIRRHRFGVAAAVAFVVVLIAFGTVMSVLAFRLARERTRSNEEAIRARQAQQTADAVNHFLQEDVLAQASASHQAGSGPNAKADPDLKVRTALDRAAAGIEGRFREQPLVEASIRQTIGQAYANLGLWKENELQWEHSLDLYRRYAGNQHPDTLNAMRLLGDVYMRQGKYPLAEPLYREGLEIERRSLGPQHPVTIGTMYSLGVLYTREGKFSQAESLLAESLELSKRVSGEMDSDTVGLMRDLAFVYTEEAKYPQAEALYQKALDLEHRLFGPEFNDILITDLYLARLYDREGKFADAEKLSGDALSSSRRALGESHPTTSFLTSALATAYLEEGRYSEAETLFNRALELDRKLFGDDAPNALTAFADSARIAALQGRYAEAERLHIHTLVIRRRVSGDQHPNTLRLAESLATLYDYEGKYREEEALLSSTSRTERSVFGDSHPETLGQFCALGRVQLRESKYAEAQTTLRAALDSYRAAGLDMWQRYNCENLLGRVLAAQKKYAQAEPLEISGYQDMVRLAALIPAPERHLVKEAGTAIPQLYKDWGHPEDAREWKQKLGRARPD